MVEHLKSGSHCVIELCPEHIVEFPVIPDIQVYK